MKTKFFFAIVILLMVVGCNNRASVVEKSEDYDFYGYKFDRNNPDVESIKKDAESGNAEAQFVYGGLFMVGNGVQQDKIEGIKWVRKSAENGFVHAQAALGACYINGKGVPQDKEEGLKWLHKAANGGNQRAKEILDDIENI